jgi:ADP-ribose pyrophosphatase YjhB (NUDIX family)
MAEQLMLGAAQAARYKIVIYRQAAAGVEILLLRREDGWALPTGVCRLAESPLRSAQRCLVDEWGLDLAVFEADCDATPEAVFVAEADACGDERRAPRTAEHEWLGVGKIRALRLEGESTCIERLMACLE